MTMPTTLPCGSAQGMKRLVGVVDASTGPLPLLPVLIGIAVLIGVTMGRPIYLRQHRTGLNDATTSVATFRTLSGAVDAIAKVRSPEEWVNRADRSPLRPSLDEWPQRIGGIRGDLSPISPISSRSLQPHDRSAPTIRDRLRHRVRLVDIGPDTAPIGVRTAGALLRLPDDIDQDPWSERGRSVLRPVRSSPPPAPPPRAVEA